MPDTWKMTAGAWGVDAEREDTITNSGGSSLRIKATSTPTAFISDLVPLDLNVQYNAYVLIRASSIDANKTVIVRMQFYAQADTETPVGEIDLVSNVPLATPNVFQYYGAFFDRADPTNAALNAARWCRFYIQKSTSQLFDIYIDRIELRRVPPSGVLTAYQLDVFEIPQQQDYLIPFAVPSQKSLCEMGTYNHPATASRRAGFTIALPRYYSCNLSLYINNDSYPSNLTTVRLLFLLSATNNLYPSPIYSPIYFVDIDDVGSSYFQTSALTPSAPANEHMVYTHHAILYLNSRDIIAAGAHVDGFLGGLTLDNVLGRFDVALLT